MRVTSDPPSARKSMNLVGTSRSDDAPGRAPPVPGVTVSIRSQFPFLSSTWTQMYPSLTPSEGIHGVSGRSGRSGGSSGLKPWWAHQVGGGATRRNPGGCPAPRGSAPSFRPNGTLQRRAVITPQKKGATSTSGPVAVGDLGWKRSLRTALLW
ncbi:hypothetical protein VUR80DRAFT_8426 [Thermomyces stellatus]